MNTDWQKALSHAGGATMNGAANGSLNRCLYSARARRRAFEKEVRKLPKTLSAKEREAAIAKLWARFDPT